MKRLLCVLGLLISQTLYGQQDIKVLNTNYWYQMSIGKNNTNFTDPSAHLEIGVLNSPKALYLVPTLATNILNPKKGFIICDVPTGHFFGYNGTTWDDLNAGGGSGTEVDPIFTASAAFGVTSTLISNWNAAYSNKINSLGVTGTTTKTISLNKQDGTSLTTTFTDLQGLTVEADPLFSASPAAGITGGNITNWNTGYNHKINSLSFTGTGTKLLTLVRQDGTSVSGTFTDQGITTETDPVYGASAASGITLTNISNWNTAYNKKINSLAVTGTGTKTITLTAQDGTTVSGSFNDDNSGVGTEVDPVFGASAASGITSFNIANWNTAYNKKVNSLAFSGTGTKTLTLTAQDGTTVTGNFTDLQGVTTEVDPVFTASVAAGITSTNTSNWNTAYNDKVNSLAVTGTGTKTITLTQQDGGTVTGNFTDQGITTETDPVISARNLTFVGGSGISVSGGTQNLAGNRSWTISNSSPDQVVTLTAGSNISITGSYPSFTIASTGGGSTSAPTVLDVRYGVIPNTVAGGYTTMYTFTIPANTLSASGQGLSLFLGGGTGGTSGGNRNVQIKVNGTIIMATNNVATTGIGLNFNMNLVRTGANTFTANADCIGVNNPWAGWYIGSATINYATSFTIVVEAFGNAANDLFFNQARLVRYPAP